MISVFFLAMFTVLATRANLFTENLSVVAALPHYRFITILTIELFAVYLYRKMLFFNQHPAYPHLLIASAITMITGMLFFPYHKDVSLDSRIHLFLTLSSVITLLIAQIIDIYECSLIQPHFAFVLRSLLFLALFLMGLAIMKSGAINSLSELILIAFDLLYIKLRTFQIDVISAHE